MKYITLLLCLCSLTLCAQVQRYTKGHVVLRDGTELKGELKLNGLATTILFKDSLSGGKMKLTARELKYAKVQEGSTRAKLSYKILNGKGKSPKIVQHITEGTVSLYKKLDADHDYYEPVEIDYTFYNDPFNNNNSQVVSTNVPMAGGMVGFALLYNLMVASEKIWFYADGDSDIVDILPIKRDQLMQRFNNCPQAMVKFRDVDDKDFDFVFFLNYYNVECAGPK